jgi:hypothetical protein
MSPTDGRWYLDPGVIEHFFSGVFEGGAAKGVAFAGALEAMRDNKCWFRSVAGASSGAITAVFVASGMPPELARVATLDTLGIMKVPRRTGLRRLYHDAGYFPAEKLATWLEGLLVSQVVKLLGPRQRGGKVTFEELYTASQIGLNIVATNLSRNEQIVFSRHDTAQCSVTDATIASASIPFLFESRILEMRNDAGALSHHTIVDGGVWANFPMFIYADSAFREANGDGHEPYQIPEHEILGFLLTSDVNPPEVRPTENFFLLDHKHLRLNAYEWSQPQPASFGAATKPGRWCRLFAPLLSLARRLTRVLDSTHLIDQGRWPRAASRCTNDLIDTISHSFGALYPVFAGCILLLFLLVASGFALEAGLDWLVGEPLWVQVLTYGLVAVLVLLLFPVAVLAIVGIIAGSLLLRPARRALYGLVTTYAAASGARPWESRRPNVIELRIDPRIGNVNFDVADELHDQVMQRAHTITSERLQVILARLRGRTSRG